MLVVVKNNLENAFLFQSIILVLLTLRLKGIDGTIKLLLCICLRVDDRCSEEHIKGSLESLGDDLENLSLSRANRPNNGYSFIPSHMLNNTKTAM